MTTKRCIMSTGVLITLFAALALAGIVQAAQSSADVTTSGNLKEQLRKKIAGASGAVDDEYVVGYRDILHVSVYGEGSMSVAGEIRAETPAEATEAAAPVADFIRGRGAGIEVRLDGRISLRHIGDVSVVGMTLTQIADYLKELYSTIYDDPVMTVTLVQSNSLQYTVMGQVVNPGLFHLDYPITVVRAVARAGGFTEWANSSITVVRTNSSGMKGKNADKGKGQRFEFDFDDFLRGRDLEKNILIQSGDVIVVH